jgi:hypothetical protein
MDLHIPLNTTASLGITSPLHATLSAYWTDEHALLLREALENRLKANQPM